MNANKKTLIIVGAVVVVLIAVLFLIPNTSGSTKLNGFAQCLKDKGAVFYGAFWCSHCQAQKALFDASAELLPYVECSTPDAKGQTQICIDKGISQYPTWYFPDGSRGEGEQSLQTLADKTGCVLPSGTDSPSLSTNGTSSPATTTEQ